MRLQVRDAATRLTVLCDDPGGPVVRHRLRACESAIRTVFDEVEYVAIPKRLTARIALFRSLEGARTVLLVRKLFTWAELRVLRASAQRLVYDLDDAVMFRDPFGGRPVSHVRRRRFRHTVRSADAVIAGNEYLAGLVRDDAPSVACTKVATPVNTDHYTPSVVPHDGFRVGWIGSRATRGYLDVVVSALRDVRDARPDLVIPVMADAPPTGMDGLPIEFTPWSEAGEVAFLRSLDAGLMPLSDDPFSRGKCGFKLLQYMASGVPSVASPVGVNVEFCGEGAGRLATSPGDWTREILAIAADPAAARAMAARARVRVDERWSSRVLGPRFAAALSPA